MSTVDPKIAGNIQHAAHALHTADDLDPLLDRIGDARLVLLGEASHGTSEYYQWRTHISKRLIEEKGFSFIAVEGDWPACYTVNRFIKGYPDASETALDALDEFERWPTWMWANWEVAALIQWLQQHNANIRSKNRAGFYGLDVYSLWESLDEITHYLQQNEPDALQAAYEAFSCFEPHQRNEQSYAWASQIVPQSCENEVLDLLMETRRVVQEQAAFEEDHEAALNAEQNAYVTANAEKYYRTMMRGGGASWNVRDHHMVDTLERLMNFHGAEAKGIIWEHNTHIGDARATDMAAANMVNVGQLARERWGEDDVVLVGFGSHRGTVIAGDSWGAPMEVMDVPEARSSSWEDLFHQSLGYDALFVFKQVTHALFNTTRPHRAIGVVYNPLNERMGNYVPTILNYRYDAFIYIDETEALHPLHLHPEDAEQPPETYPWGV